MNVPEQKQARGGSAALVARDTLEYIVCSSSVTTYTFTSLVRHIMVKTHSSYGLVVTLPPVAECAGQIYSIYLDVHDTTDVTINDNGDDPDMTLITLNDHDEFAVLFSNGVRWMFLQKEIAG